MRGLEYSHSGVVTFISGTDYEEIEEIIGMFEKIANEKSWNPGGQLRAYPDSSVYFVLYVSGCLAGALQLVCGDTKKDMPCLTVWPELDIPFENGVADIALLAMDTKYRGTGNLFWLLCAEMWRYCTLNNINEIWAEATPRNVKIYRKIGWPLEIVGPLRSHWNEYCYPCHMNIKNIEKVIRERAVVSNKYAKILEWMYR